MAPRIYDATNNTWISDGVGRRPLSGTAPSTVSPVEGAPSSGMKPDARATGGLWQLPPSEWTTEVTVKRFPFSASRPRSRPRLPETVGTPAHRVAEFLTTVAGMLLFASIALFFLILA